MVSEFLYADLNVKGDFSLSNNKMNQSFILDDIMMQDNNPLMNNEEALFLACSEKERNKILEVKITRNTLVDASPSIRVNIDVRGEYKETFWLTCTPYGFTITEVMSNEIQAYTILNKNLKAYTDLDVEMLRGFASLAFMNLEHKIDKHVDAFEMLYSPAFTEYLYKCIDFLKS